MWVYVEGGLEKGRAAEVTEDHAVTVGSGAGCTIALADADVAPLHASFRLGDAGHEAEEQKLWLVPLEQPVALDGTPITEPTAVKAGQRVTIGDVELTLRDKAPAGEDADLTDRDEFSQALGSDGDEADDQLTPVRERRRIRRATGLAIGALALAGVAGVLALVGVFGDGDDNPQVDVAQIVEDVQASTVRVVARERGQEATGSGWVLDAKKGLVVTNFHVVNGASDFEIAVEGAERDAEVVGAAPCDDLAVLSVEDASGLKSLRLAQPDSIDQGEQTIAVGYAAGASEGEELAATTGVVSVPSQPLRSPTPDSPNFPDMIQTDAAINPGNSGGPLLDTDRRVIGVNTAVLVESGGVPLQNVGYAIGVQRVREVVDELKQKRSLGWLGTGLEFPPPAELADAGLPRGVVTLSAVPGTPADDAGLQGKSVVITSIDGERMSGRMTDYCDEVGSKRTGESVELQVVADRGGSPRKLALELG
ncbi:MAG TPA: trypsin-like peptidase domain-containing protein [Solirubrobacteraceae bacterium]|nr:trypsin-like peptidase domain-containing protein [Solirubrobacteraceae bacterium]